MTFFIAFILSIIVSLALDFGDFGMIITYIFFLILAVIFETLKNKGDVAWKLKEFLREMWENAKTGFIFLLILALIAFMLAH